MSNIVQGDSKNISSLYNRTIWVALAIVLFVLVAAAIILLAYPLGRLDCHKFAVCKEPKDYAKAISDARTALTQIVLAAGVGGTLIFTWLTYRRSSQDSLRAARNSEENLTLARKNSEETSMLARESRASENFIKATEQMGSAQPTLNIGGIHGLGRILQTAKLDGDYWPVMDVLTAFVRENFPVVDPRKERRKAPENLQAALDVLARRWFTGEAPDRDGKNSPVDLHETDLRETWMAKGHFEYGFFVGCDFTKADLTSSYFRRANFSKAIFDKVEMADSDWSAVCFAEERFGVAMFGAADLRNADLSRAHGLESVDLSNAKGNKKTKLPPNVPRPDNWSEAASAAGRLE